MTIDEAIKLIQLDVDDEDVAWDTPLGEAYKLSLEALKQVRKERTGYETYAPDLLPGEDSE